MATAVVTLEIPAGTERIEFEDVSVDHGSNELKFVFSNASGERITVAMERRQLKKMLNWRMLMSL